jgi:hypothetical protein
LERYERRAARAGCRQRYQEFRRLPPEERARLIDVYRRYRMMSPEGGHGCCGERSAIAPEQRQMLRERRLRSASSPLALEGFDACTSSATLLGRRRKHAGMI